ncbi:GNAT family N-acetyltransferase [Aneurinibacillus migulanus]|uniref:GNAT family N-acetyltransferase n=1 Tax=Aneurinibacillus migulanus TaxID=47500 RepID=UPI002E251F2D|nr:GNAT family N-acetyltransferase [Aneurinibacillus migulanus]MED4727048.1 GNAT family N-acetyltransferase [Aneurinibacillus migulanus]
MVVPTVVQLFEVKHDERHTYLNLLLLADECEEIVKKYLHDGELYSVHNEEHETIGVILMIKKSRDTVEIKNIAVKPIHQGKGYGKAILQTICEMYKEKGYQSIIVGTANSSIENLIFYQKAGFRMTGIKRDFFAAYPEPIFENGIRALDMIMLEKTLYAEAGENSC